MADPNNYQLLYEQSQAENAQLQYAVASLSHQLEQLKKMIFGTKSERFVTADNNTAAAQLSLSLEAATIATCKITDATKVEYLRTKTEVTENKVKAHPGRMKLPESLRRETILLQPDTEVSGLRKIGDEVTEVLDYVPGELFVK